MDFVTNFIAFQHYKHFENRLRFDKVTESLKVGTFFETQCILPIALCVQFSMRCHGIHSVMDNSFIVKFNVEILSVS